VQQHNSEAVPAKKSSGPSRLVILLGVACLLVAIALVLSRCVTRDSRAATSTAATPTPTPRPGPAVFSWFFAAGSSVAPQRTSYAVLNPGESDAVVTVDLYGEDGRIHRRQLVVGRSSQVEVDGGVVMPGTAFGASIRSTAPVYVERQTIITTDGVASTAAGRPSSRWYFADAGGGPLSDVRLSVFNPEPGAATINVEIVAEDGALTPVTFQAAGGRPTTQNLAEWIPSIPCGLIVRSSVPVVAEVTVARPDGQLVYDGAGVAASELSRAWYVPVVTTTAGSDMHLSLLNPGGDIANLSVTTIQNRVRRRLDTPPMLPGSRRDITITENLTAMVVESDKPLAAQSHTIGADGTTRYAFGSLAAGAGAQMWYLPGAAEDARYASRLVLFNPFARTARVTVKVIYVMDGQSASGDSSSSEPAVSKIYPVRSSVRLVVPLQQLLAAAGGGQRKSIVAVIVESDQPLVTGRITEFRWASGATASPGILRRLGE
jgi:hypothetical protein